MTAFERKVCVVERREGGFGIVFGPAGEEKMGEHF
jgi:hypothetical protein